MTPEDTSRTRNRVLMIAVLVLLAVLPFLPFFTGETLSASDTIKSIPFMQWGLDHLAQGSLGQWIPGLFGGMPAFAALVTAPVNPVEVSLLVFGQKLLFNGYADPVLPHIVYLMVLGLGVWLFLRHEGLSAAGALLLAGLAMSMTTLVGLAGAGHTVKLWTLCQMPLSLFLLARVYRNPGWIRVLPAGFSLGLLLLSKHVQVAYYFLLGAGIYFLVRAILDHGPGAWKLIVSRLAFLLAAVVSAVLLASILFLPVLNYSDQSIRSSASETVTDGGYAAAYSYPPEDLLTWAIPAAKGYGGGDYWGGLEYTAFPLTMGLVPLVLLALGLFSPGRRRIYPLLLAAGFLFLMGIGRNGGPLFSVFVDLFPFYAKFRAHMWAIAVSQILLLLAAAEGWRMLVPAQGTPANPGRTFRAGLVCAAGAVLLAIWGMVVSPGDGAVADGDSRFGMRDRMQIEAYFAGRGQTLSPAEFNQVKNSIRAQRGKVLAGSLWKEAVVLLLLGGVLVMYSRGSVKEGGLAVLLLVLGVADAKPEYGKALHFSPRQSILQELRPDPMIQHLQGLASQDLFRVWPKGVYPYNQLIAWNLQSVLGYQGARLNITDQFLDAGAAQGYGMDREIHPHVLDVLNVKYTIAREMLEGQVVVGKQQDQLLLSRESAAERVSLPGRITTVASPKDALERILAPDFDARSEVVLLESPGFTSNATGSARVTDYQDEEMTIEVTCDGPGVLQISEIFYPNGWTASVNGQDAAILNSNFATRAILLPAAGDHRIVLRFAPTDFRLGAGISGLTLLAMLGAWGVLWFRDRRKD